MPMHDNSANPDDSKLGHPIDLSHRKGESDDFMTLQQGSDPASRKVGYELTDANVRETAIFLVVLGVSLFMVFFLAYGIGTLINNGIASQDGPTNKWSRLAGAKPANMQSDPQMKQQQLDQMVKKFPQPRLQIDDGNVEVAHMHAREDMLLNHYSWVDEQKQTVRIPIDRAMQLLAKRGLAVETQQGNSDMEANTEGNQDKGKRAEAQGKQSASGQYPDEPVMFGDGSRAVTAPLTDGFARTAPELRMMEARQQALETGAPRKTQAAMQSGH